MTTNIVFVCHANYCRSPVAEYLLKSFGDKNLNITSAGIDPIGIPSMDPRSMDYLKRNDIPFDIHTPKRITSNIIKSSDIIFSLDYSIFFKLKSNFLSANITMINHSNKETDTSDPFKYSDIEDYFNCMDNISSLINYIYKNVSKFQR